MSDAYGNDAIPNVPNVPMPAGGGFVTPPGDGFPTPKTPDGVPPAGYFNNPAVPGDPGHPKKGQTSTNTTALKSFATNIDSLAGQLQQLVDPLSQITLKPGVFETAQDRILDPILGSGRLRDNTQTVIQNVITSMHDLSDAVAKAARDYETIDDFNKITMGKYNEYFSQVNTDINSGLSQPAAG